jgi:hypothetical protein
VAPKGVDGAAVAELVDCKAPVGVLGTARAPDGV